MRNRASNHQIPQGPFISKPTNIIQNNLRQKRRNDNSHQKSVGIAFLNRGCCVPKKTCASWFRAMPTKDEIIQIARQNPQAIPYVMQKLNLTFNSAQEFEMFIGSIDPNDTNFLKTLRDHFNQAINQRISILPPLQEIEYPFSDIRYSKAEIKHQMLSQPIILGASDQEISLNPPPITTGNHIVLQSFISGVQPPVIKWPQSLSIYVNDKLVKPPCIIRHLLIDLTYFGQVKSIRITYHKERNFYVLILREASYRSFDEIINEMQSLPVTDEVFREEELSLLCPISGEIMKEPGKGRNCNHTQSFDLKNFLQIATIQHRWICPVCNQNLEFSDLIYSHESKKKIDEFKSEENNASSEPLVFNDPSALNDDNDFNDFNFSDF